jgi:hypothetical protein
MGECYSFIPLLAAQPLFICTPKPARTYIRVMLLAAAWMVAAVSVCAQAVPTSGVPTFGTTVVIPFGLEGHLYLLEPGTLQLPEFEGLEPVGTIYTSSLNIEPRAFTDGFPGVTDRFEWFALDYRGGFWIEKPGRYDFSLISDDGSRLYIDDRLAIDNGNHHPPLKKDGHVSLAGGIHRIRVTYFQGPRELLALVLRVKGPGDRSWRVFSTSEFKPPPNPADWKYSGLEELVDKGQLKTRR